MNPVTLLALLALTGALYSLYNGVLIAQDLRTRGYPARPALVRFMIFKYLADYRRVTLQETGEIGPLYHRCATSGTITIVLAAAMIAVKMLS